MEETMLEKTYRDTAKGRVCDVTFTLPATVNAETAHLLGEFNDWDPTINPMKKLKDHSFLVKVTIPHGLFRFRYLLDGERWENDWEADGYAPNEYGSEDSVLEI